MMFAQQAPPLFFLLQDSATSLVDGKTKYDSWPRMLTWESFRDSARNARPCTTYHHAAGHAWFIRDSRGARRIQQKKHIRVFRSTCAGGGRGLEFCPVLVASW